MAFTVRPARIEDVAQIIPWTTNTFDWGDYVPDRIASWIEAADSEVFVCADENDRPVAVSHAVMLSPTEGWLEAARVHPDHKRSGMGTAMNHAGVEWARQHGARVVRLATEEHNVAARRQVESLGYRATSSWVHANLDLGRNPPAPSSGAELRKAPSSDVDAAWMFWSTSDLAHEGRGLIAWGWQWRKATPDDLRQAAVDGNLYQSPSGWLIADKPDDDWIRTLWLATSPDQAPSLLESLVAMAVAQGVAEVTVKAPNIAWISEALHRVVGEPREILVYTLPV